MPERSRPDLHILLADFRAGLFWAATSTLVAALAGWAWLAPLSSMAGHPSGAPPSARGQQGGGPWSTGGPG